MNHWPQTTSPLRPLSENIMFSCKMNLGPGTTLPLRPLLLKMFSCKINPRPGTTPRLRPLFLKPVWYFHINEPPWWPPLLRPPLQLWKWIPPGGLTLLRTFIFQCKLTPDQGPPVFSDCSFIFQCNLTPKPRTPLISDHLFWQLLYFSVN